MIEVIVLFFFLMLLLALLLYLFCLCPRMPRRSMAAFSSVDYAHRGLWNHTRCENSLPAFRAACEAGYGIELDVHLTQDGVLVVHHDDSLLRTCGQDLCIAQSTFAQLRACTLHLPDGTDTGETLPTLDEVLSVVAGRVPLIIELKSEGNAAALCQAFHARMQSYRGVWCMESFDPLCVYWFRRHAPDVIRGQLAFGLSGDVGRRILPHWEAFAVASLVENVLSRPDFVAYDMSSERGLNLPMRLLRCLRPQLVAWTIRTPEALSLAHRRYDIAIFEGFLPDCPKQKAGEKQ